jgi:hypothetical protein
LKHLCGTGLNWISLTHRQYCSSSSLDPAARTRAPGISEPSVAIKGRDYGSCGIRGEMGANSDDKQKHLHAQTTSDPEPKWGWLSLTWPEVIIESPSRPVISGS